MKYRGVSTEQYLQNGFSASETQNTLSRNEALYIAKQRGRSSSDSMSSGYATTTHSSDDEDSNTSTKDNSHSRSQKVSYPKCDKAVEDDDVTSSEEDAVRNYKINHIESDDDNEIFTSSSDNDDQQRPFNFHNVIRSGEQRENLRRERNQGFESDEDVSQCSEYIKKLDINQKSSNEEGLQWRNFSHNSFTSSKWYTDETIQLNNYKYINHPWIETKEVLEGCINENNQLSPSDSISEDEIYVGKRVEKIHNNVNVTHNDKCSRKIKIYCYAQSSRVVDGFDRIDCGMPSEKIQNNSHAHLSNPFEEDKLVNAELKPRSPIRTTKSQKNDKPYQGNRNMTEETSEEHNENNPRSDVHAGSPLMGTESQPSHSNRQDASHFPATTNINPGENIPDSSLPLADGFAATTNGSEIPSSADKHLSDDDRDFVFEIIEQGGLPSLHKTSEHQDDRDLNEQAGHGAEASQAGPYQRAIEQRIGRSDDNNSSYDAHTLWDFINYVSDDGDTNLMVCCCHSELLASCYYLIEKSVLFNLDINHRNIVGETALWNAAYYHQSDLVGFLVEQGADPGVRVRGQSAVERCAKLGCTDVLTAMLTAHSRRRNNNNQLGSGFLSAAALFQQPQVIQHIVNQLLSLDDADILFDNLTETILNHQPETLEYILQQVPEIANLVHPRTRMTLLHEVAIIEDMDAQTRQRFMDILVKHGAAINARDIADYIPEDLLT